MQIFLKLIFSTILILSLSLIYFIIDISFSYLNYSQAAVNITFFFYIVLASGAFVLVVAGKRPD